MTLAEIRAALEALYGDTRDNLLDDLDLQILGGLADVVTDARSGAVVTAAEVKAEIQELYGYQPADITRDPKLVTMALIAMLKDSIALLGGGGGGAVSTWTVLTVNMAGQTAFTLPSAPASPTTSFLSINGQKARYAADYTIGGSTLTWLNADYALQPDDSVELIYQ